MSKLGDFVRVQGGYAFKSSELSDDKTGVPVIKIGNITGGSFVDLSNYQSVSFQLFEKTKSFATKDNDILIAMTGANVGKTSRVPVNSDAYLINQRVGRFLLKEDCPYTSDFIYYVVSSKQAYQYFSRVADGAAQPNISGKTIEDLEFPNIDSRCANKIGNILKSLDDKIQLNTQINQTLEQIAQTIFKSWFIDFDPVHAKANALASGQTLEQATQAAMAVISGKNTQELHRLQTANPEQYQQLWEIAEAFPSGFYEEGVPRGWAVKRIEDVIRKIPTGKKYSQKTAFEVGNIPILDQGKSGVIGYHNDEAGVKASIENPVIVFANHTCYMRLISYDFSAIQNVFAFVGKESNVLWTYLATLGKQEFTEYKGHFPDFLIKEIIVPNNELTELFGVVVKEHFQQIACNDKQNKTLANLRDLLLPKLLGGYL